jgi:hypothetical protein
MQDAKEVEALDLARQQRLIWRPRSSPISILSTLALLVTAAAVKSTDRVAELEAEIVELKVDLAGARREADMWRDRAIERIEPLQPAGRNCGLQQAMALQNAQYAQQALSAFAGFRNCVPSRAQVWGALSA